MKVLKVTLGVVPEGLKETKAVWKLKKEHPQLYLFLANIDFLAARWRMMVLRRVVSEQQLKEGVNVGPYYLKTTNKLKGVLGINMDTLNKMMREKEIEEEVEYEAWVEETFDEEEW